jgi:hypothetical protein
LFEIIDCGPAIPRTHFELAQQLENHGFMSELLILARNG